MKRALGKEAEAERHERSRLSDPLYTSSALPGASGIGPSIIGTGNRAPS